MSMLGYLRKHVKWGGRFNMSTTIMIKLLNWIWPEVGKKSNILKEVGDFYLEISGNSEDFYNILDGVMSGAPRGKGDSKGKGDTYSKSTSADKEEPTRAGNTRTNDQKD